MQEQNNIVNSLAHTKWNCKYHIVFAPKYRRKVFYEEKRMEIREILRKLCQWKGVEVIEGEICPDHIHMLVSIPPKMSVAGFMGYLKGNRRQTNNSHMYNICLFILERSLFPLLENIRKQGFFYAFLGTIWVR